MVNLSFCFSFSFELSFEADVSIQQLLQASTRLGEAESALKQVLKIKSEKLAAVAEEKDLAWDPASCPAHAQKQRGCWARQASACCL